MSSEYLRYAKMIDHALLVPTMTESQLIEGCHLALAYDIASVCIMPFYLKRCAELLAGSTVAPSTTIGFPHGGHTSTTKRAEAEQALADGGEELDMVVNISQVLSGQWDYVAADIQGVVEAVRAAGKKVKVIFENCYLQDEHKRRLCQICTDLQVDWVKTSTGYGTSGATLEDLRLMLDSVGPGIQVKAAGGIRDFATLKEIHHMGVTRCGTSRTQSMLDAAREELKLPPIDYAGPASSTSSY